MPEVRKGLLPMGLLPSGAAPGSGFGFRASFEPRISAFSADERGSGLVTEECLWLFPRRKAASIRGSQ
jgi:hypothetical protein